MARVVPPVALLVFVLACEKPAADSSESAGPSARADSPTSAASAVDRSTPADARGRKLRIAVIPKGTTHDFWKSIHAGARRAERELGNVEVIFRGPEREDDREQQVSLVQNFISSRADAIVLAPLDDKALLPAVRQATAAKIPVVIIDSGLAGEVGKDFVSYAATNNFLGGQLGARRLAEVLGDKGRVLLLRYQEGSASTTEREAGFVEEIGKHEGIELIDPRRYAGATRATAQEAAENLLTVNAEIQGVFCPNESSTFGMLLALRSRGLAGRVRFVGFDSSEGLVDALRAAEIDGLVVQNPKRMGYLGVKTAVDFIAGRTVEPLQDTGVVVVTKDNLDTPDIQQLLSPDAGGP